MRKSTPSRMSRREYAQMMNKQNNERGLRNGFDIHWSNRLENDPDKSAYISSLLKKYRQGARDERG